jgi:hypothetical protein
VAGFIFFDLFASVFTITNLAQHPTNGGSSLVRNYSLPNRFVAMLGKWQ